MKTILSYGASLSWGFNPVTMGRYSYEQRWTGILQKKLGSNYLVIEEGLNGRTTSYDDPFMPYRNGSKDLPMILESHVPIDLVILLLGTNDLKPHLHGSAKKAALGCANLIRIILESQAGHAGKPPAILLLSPPTIGSTKGLMNILFKGAEEESWNFSEHYHQVSLAFNTHFLDTRTFLTPSSADGVHLDIENNAILAEEVFLVIKNIFENKT